MLAELPVKSGLRSYGGLPLMYIHKMVEMGKGSRITIGQPKISQLIVNVLNIVYMFGFAMKSMYLCIAKDPYYGRFEVRCSTHGYANPLRDAAGCRGIFW